MNPSDKDPHDTELRPHGVVPGPTRTPERRKDGRDTADDRPPSGRDAGTLPPLRGQYATGDPSGPLSGSPASTPTGFIPREGTP